MAGDAGRVAGLGDCGAVTVFFGVVLLFAPRIAFRLFRLQTKPEHPEAIAEARATMAGFYLGLGLCCVLLAQPLLYMALGFSWLFTAFGRIVSMMSDRGNTLYNWIWLVFDAGAGGASAGLCFRLRPLNSARVCRGSGVNATKLPECSPGNVLRSPKACARRQSTFDRGMRSAYAHGRKNAIRPKI